MKKIKSVLVMLLIGLLLVGPVNTASALTPILINPNLTLPDIFFSRHEVIKAIPVYRALVANKLHWYTTNEDEFNYWISRSKINNDGIAGFISPVPLPYTVPMWNMVKKSVEQYFVTSEAARDYVIGKYGYQDCGIMGYVVALDDTAHGNAQMYQWYRGATDNYITDLNDLYGIENDWDADHYYNSGVGYLGSYEYQGPQFRIWSDASTLQEINVLSPNGGESLTGGTKVDIKWNTLIPGGSITLAYSLDPAQGWTVLAENLENNSSYSWTVPNSPTSKAIVEARWTYEGIDANCFDQSDKYFSIKTGSGTPINWLSTMKPVGLQYLFAPAAPTNLAVTSNLLQKQPKLYWKDNSANESAFVVERKPAGGSYTKLAQVAANQTQYVDTSAAAGQAYNYRVKAINGTVSSGYSNEVAGSAYAALEVKPPKPGTGAVSMLFTLDSSTYTVNGVMKAMDVSPASINGRTMLPIRFAADPLGAQTVWDGNQNKVTVTLGDTKIELWIGSNTAKINGAATLIDPNNPDVKPLIMNSRTMLPMRFVTEKLGCTVEWIPLGSQIKVDHPGPYLNPQPEPPIGKIPLAIGL